MSVTLWRRTGGAAAVCFAVCCAPSAPKSAFPSAPPTATAALAPTPTPRAFAYPPAQKGSVVDDYHGTRVADPYRGLEDADDPATVSWVDAENALTRRLLDRPERTALKAQLTKLFDYARISIPTRRGRFYFFSKNSGLQNQSVYYVQPGPTGEPRVLIDPNALSEDGTVALTTTSPSHDGRLLGYTLSRSGSDRQEIYVRDVATGRDLPDKLLWAKFTSIAWTIDGHGFYYTRYPQPGTVPAGEEHYFPKLCYHRLGDPQSKDGVVFEKPAEKGVGISAEASWDGRWLLISSFQGASNKCEVRVIDLKKTGFRPALLFKGYEDGFAAAEVVRGRLFCWTDRGAPLGRIIAVDLTRVTSGQEDEAKFDEIVPQTRDQLEAGSIVAHSLVLSYLRNASNALEVHGLDGKLEKAIDLPGIGTVAALSGEPDDPDMFLSFTSFTVPTTNFRYDFASQRLEVFQKTAFPLDTSRYETGQIWYPSKDGTRVSMFLIHRKGLPRDGNRPVFLTAYGGFQVNITPYFFASDYPFLEKDGLIAIPNLRGGGEYGEQWHKAGMREKKQNVFDDFIAAAQWLVQDGWTKPARLAIQGASNGGLLVSAVMTQRPELFGAVICEVPVADMLRYQNFTVGRYWIPEYGDPEVPADFEFLSRYSPYQNVKDRVAYPPTLVTTADTDDRVAPGHAKKLAARLQDADAGRNPILLRVETKAGHGGGKPLTKRIDERTDIWAFVFWQLGMN